MARANLSAMLDRLDEEPAKETGAAQPTTETRATPQAKTDTTAPVGKKPKGSPVPEEAPIAQEPLYLRLERKEARLREDQIADLSAHARRLNRAKAGGGERITENTLIRVAIDLLLTQMSYVQGRDEAELRNSVTSRLTAD